MNRDVDVTHAVIAPGGSVVYCKDAMEHYKKTGTVVYLQVSFETIDKRLKNAKNRGVVLKEGRTLRICMRKDAYYLNSMLILLFPEEGLNWMKQLKSSGYTGVCLKNSFPQPEFSKYAPAR